MYPKYDIELIYHPKMYPDIESYVLVLLFTFWFHERKVNKSSYDILVEKKNQRLAKILSPENVSLEAKWDHIRIEGTSKARANYEAEKDKEILTHRYVIAKEETERYTENIEHHRGYDGMCRAGPRMW